MNKASVLLVIDVQNDFLPGGALPVPRGDEVIPVINGLAPLFENVVITQDWYPRGHASFASNHPGVKEFCSMAMRYGEQTMWPDHCVQGTRGAQIADALDIQHAQLILRKGWNPHVDSYSAFVEADQTTTGLAGLLRGRGVSSVYCCGLAGDICVAASALASQALRFETFFIADACRSLSESDEQLHARMRSHGIRVITTNEIAHETRRAEAEV